MNYVFYDTETTGTDPAFDQIIQFAAVLTDDQLNELDRFDIRCRLLPYVVPSPAAMLVNRTSVRDLTDPTRPSHYEMIRQIREKLLSWSPAMFIGFNSLGFDEHAVRQAFYQTLHPIYLTNTGANARCDALRLAHAASMFAPRAISIPITDADRPTFRLDRLARENGFHHEQAHDALADVEATIHLCRLIRSRAPDLWVSSLRLCRKPAILDFTATEPAFCLTDFYFGRPYSRIVAAIGRNEQNSNEVYIYNLTFPLEYIGGLGENRLLLRLPTRPKPVDTLRANTAPILRRLEQAPASAQGLAVGRDELCRRADALRADAEFRTRLIVAFEAVRPRFQPSPHVEQQIYDRFISDADERLLARFHASPWDDRLSIVGQLEDARLRELGVRLIFCERPDLFELADREFHVRQLARRLLGLDRSTPWLTLRQAIEQATELAEKPRGVDLDLLHEHRNELQRRLADAMRAAA